MAKFTKAELEWRSTEKIIRRRTAELDKYKFIGRLGDIAKFINDCVVMYGEDATLDLDYEYREYCVDWKSIETDEEFADRQGQIEDQDNYKKNAAIERKTRELRELARLRKKYPNK